MSDHKLDQIIEAQTRMDVKMDTVREKVDKCLVGLYGSSGHPEQGLNIKVDRLQQTEQKRSKIIWALILGVASLVTKQLWAFISGDV